MKLKTCQTFAQLCESLTEASTAMNLITGRPGGVQVVRKLHKDMGLGHNIEYSPIDKISWSDLKDSYSGSWVIIVGTNGIGAIKSSGQGYEAVASTGEEPETARDSRGGNIKSFLKGKLGKLQKFYVGQNTKEASRKQEKRAEIKKTADTAIDRDTIIKKFKPLWAKAMTAAIADVKGHINNMVQNEAFDKAIRKLEYIKNLQIGLEAIEAGETRLDVITRAVQTALYMAASYYYPEETGELNRERYGRGVVPENYQGTNRILSDISKGDTQKLGTVLSYFKRNLISG